MSAKLFSIGPPTTIGTPNRDQINTRREGGRDFAIAALVLSGIHTLIYGVVFLVLLSG